MQKNVMAVIYAHMNKSLFCYPSRNKIKECLGRCSVHRITEATNKAVKLGLLKKGKRRINGDHSVCTYRGIPAKKMINFDS